MCTFETSPCMLATRAHAFQHVRVVPVHTGVQAVIVSSAYQNLPTYGYDVLQRFTKETFGSYTFSVLRIGRKQHVPDSSNHSLHLIRLFSFSNLEGNFWPRWFD